jgi:hypothetical protein
MSDSPLDLDKLAKADAQTRGYHAIKVSDGVEGLRALASRMGAGIDCDLY